MFRAWGLGISRAISSEASYTFLLHPSFVLVVYSYFGFAAGHLHRYRLFFCIVMLVAVIAIAYYLMYWCHGQDQQLKGTDYWMVSLFLAISLSLFFFSVLLSSSLSV